MNTDESILLKAFPECLRDDVKILLGKIPLISKINCSGYYKVRINDEKISIPYRVYCEVPNVSDANKALISMKY